jgi:hypothetical protein
MSDIQAVIVECEKRRYENHVSERAFQEISCKKLKCRNGCTLCEYIENLELSGFIKRTEALVEYC